MAWLSVSAAFVSAVAATAMRFSDFSDVAPLKGDPAPPRIADSAEAQEFRTDLRSKAKLGPNFSGHFTFIRIGCGTGCSKIAVIDSADGKVVFPQSLPYVHVADWWHEPIGPAYSLESSLLIVYGRAGSEEAPCGVSYFNWEKTDLRLLRFEPHDCGEYKEE